MCIRDSQIKSATVAPIKARRNIDPSLDSRMMKPISGAIRCLFQPIWHRLRLSRQFRVHGGQRVGQHSDHRGILAQLARIDLVQRVSSRVVIIKIRAHVLYGAEVGTPATLSGMMSEPVSSDDRKIPAPDVESTSATGWRSLRIVSSPPTLMPTGCPAPKSVSIAAKWLATSLACCLA